LGSLIFNPARGEPARVSRVGSLLTCLSKYNFIFFFSKYYIDYENNFVFELYDEFENKNRGN